MPGGPAPTSPMLDTILACLFWFSVAMIPALVAQAVSQARHDRA